MTTTSTPTPIDILMQDAAGNKMSVRGESVGGGAAVIRRIDGIDVYVTGESTSIVVRQRDVAGVLAHIAQSLSERGVSIATTRMYRERRGDTAYTVLETDQDVDVAAKTAIESNPAICDVRIIPGDAGSAAPCASAGASDEGCDAQQSAEALDRALQRFANLDFASGADLLAWCETNGASISEAFWPARQL